MDYSRHPIHIIKDYSPKMRSQHAVYRDAMTTLCKLGMQPTLLFPVRLIITGIEGLRYSNWTCILILKMFRLSSKGLLKLKSTLQLIREHEKLQGS